MWSFQLLKIRGVLEANPNQVVEMTVLPTLIMTNYGIGHEKQVICYFISKRGISFSERMTQKAKISMDFQPIETRTRFPAICGTQSIKMIKLGLPSRI